MVWAWGQNDYSQLGNSDNIGTLYPNPLPVQVVGPNGQGFLTGVKAVAAGSYQSLALKSDGTLWAWGYGVYGQLGDGTYNSIRSSPVQVVGPNGQGFLTDIIAVAGGDRHSLALKSDGTVWAWGDNSVGQLGDGGTEEAFSAAPVQVVSPNGQGFLTGVVAISAGLYHSLAVKSDGTLWAWGYNREGELGIGTRDLDPHPLPTQVKEPNGLGFLTGVKAVAGGNDYSLAVKSDGTVWAWGLNNAGQLGIGTSDYDAHPTPAPVSGLTGVVTAAAGYDHSLALISPIALSGVLTLQGLAPTADARTITFAFRPADGSGDFSLPASIRPDGAFTLGGLPQKPFTLHIKGRNYLAVNRSVDLTNGSVSGLTGTLLPGDINDDNKVTIADLGLLADAFNTYPYSPKWNANADLNGDGTVSILDLGLLADSFGKQGDP
jgi:alpha-tubulin suppressor-like RCC1 family protein